MKPSLLLHPRDSPGFSAAIRAAGCGVEVRVNDVPVFRDLTGGALNLVLPINEWLFCGGNEIWLEIWPSGGTRPAASLELCCRRLRGPLQDSFSLAMLEHGRQPPADEWPQDDSASDGEDPEAAAVAVRPGELSEFFWKWRRVRRPGGSLLLAGTFLLPDAWPERPWQNASALDAGEDRQSILWQITQQFWAAFQRRDLPTARRLMAARTRRLATAYQLAAHEIDEALLFPQLLQSPDWQASPLREDGLSFEAAGGRRLARLVDEATGESPLRLVNETEGVEAVIDAWWGSDGHWVLLA